VDVALLRVAIPSPDLYRMNLEVRLVRFQTERIFFLNIVSICLFVCFFFSFPMILLLIR
jgi:hypothetical protein